MHSLCSSVSECSAGNLENRSAAGNADTGCISYVASMREFLKGEVYFPGINPDTTFTEPAGGRNTMTVSYYNSRENAVDINSGRGYTRDERIKPDYAAPGVAVTIGQGIQ